MRALLFVLVSLFFSSALLAKEIDVSKSTFHWKAEKKISKGHVGTIKLKSASAQFIKNKIQQAEFVMDMKSFDVTDLEGKWKKKFMDHVSGPDFFEVNKYPTAKLIINKQVGNDHVMGTLTIKDKSHPIKIKFTQSGNNYKGDMVFDRTKFGVVYNSSNFFANLAADKIIKNDVVVSFNVVVK